MRRKKQTILVALMLALATDFLVSEHQLVYAKKTDQIKRKNIKAFEEIQAIYEQGNYQEASTLLDQLSKNPKLNLTEQAYIDSFRGNICFLKGDLECTIHEYDKISAKRTSIPSGLSNPVLKALASIHLKQKKYAKAIEYAEQIRPKHTRAINELTLFKGQAYYLLKDYPAALTHVLPLVKNADALNHRLKSSWLNLLIDIHGKLGQLESALNIIDSLNPTNPKAKYKLRIAALYGEHGQNQEMETIHRQLLEKGLAQYKDGQLILWRSDGEILPIYRPNPTYPRKAAIRGQEGFVDLMFDIDKHGKTKNIRVTNSSRKTTFNKAAIQSAKGYIFDPVIKNGEPAEVKDQEFRISFQLEK